MILPSGVSVLDRLLGGGLKSGLLTHVYGEAASGKTTLALQFASAAVRLDYQVTYINSEGESPLERYQQISGIDIQHIDPKIKFMAPRAFKEQGEIFEDLELYTREKTRLVIIDTFTRLYRTVLENKRASYAAHRELNRQTGILKGFARNRDAIVLVLNQVRASMKYSNEIEPVAENILDYWSDYVLRINVGRKQGERILRLVRPESNPPRCVLYQTSRGLAIKPEEKE